MNYDDLWLRLMLVMVRILVLFMIIEVVFAKVLIGIMMRLVVNKDRLFLVLMFRLLIFHNDRLLVMHFVVLIMMNIGRQLMMHRSVVLIMLYINGLMLLVMHINRLLFMLVRLLINHSCRLVLIKHSLWLLIDYFLMVMVFGLNVLNHFLIFMNFLLWLWLVAMMLIVIAWLTLLNFLSVLVFDVSTMRLLVDALILFVVGIVLIIIVGV